MTDHNTTISDRFGRIHDYLRISLTDKCNFRCTYCMPEEKMQFAKDSALMSAEEILKICKIFVDMGIKKIRFTGGEPLLRKDAHQIIQSISELPVKLAITTNGYFIDEYVDLFEQIGLNSINLSIDSLNQDKFNRITQRKYFEKVMSNIRLLEDRGLSVKLNCVAIKGFNEDEISDFVKMTINRNIHVRFIEFMPFKNNRWERENVLGYQEILQLIRDEYNIEKLKDHKNDTSKSFKVKGARGTFAVISTITAPFCQDCNRIRVTATGKLRNCLFAREETDLLTPLRMGEDIKSRILNSFEKKYKKFGGWEDFEDKQEDYDSGRSMITIGG